MKKYIIFSILALAATFAACTTDSTESVTSRPVTQLKVSYNYDGRQDISYISHPSTGGTVTVDVVLNNQDVYWNVKSNKEWCTVVEEPHQGSGSFKLNITANREFAARDDESYEPTRGYATLSFTAGAYEIADAITVTQEGNTFLLSKSFALGSSAAGSTTVNVQVPAGTNWSFEKSDWLTVTKGTKTTADNVDTWPVTVAWAAGASEARYGSVDFTSGESTAQMNIFQFGTDTALADGKISLSAENAAPVSFTVPSAGVKEVVYPDSGITCDVADNYDGTTTYTLGFADNISDTRSNRTAVVEVQMLDGTVAELPTISQAYTPAHGLISAAGFQLFADEVAKGDSADLSEWSRDGVVVMLNDIDMSSVAQEWSGVGTSGNPFKGKFDGQGYKFTRHISNQAIFRVCQDATISNVVIDGSCEIKSATEYSSGGSFYVTTLALLIKNTTIENCVNHANVTMQAAGVKEAKKTAYVSGLVGCAEAGSIVRGCVNNATITATAASAIPAPSDSKNRSTMYLGGVVGCNYGTIEECTNNGAISDAAVIWFRHVGGVAGYNTSTGVLTSSTNNAVVANKSNREESDASREICIGGITGTTEGTLSGNTNAAAVRVTAGMKMQYVGGIAGQFKAGTVADNINNGDQIYLDKGGDNAARQFFVGGLYGYVIPETTIDFTTDTSASKAAINVENFENSSKGYIYFALGGLIGKVGANPLNLIAPKHTANINMSLPSGQMAAQMVVGGIVGGNVNDTAGRITVSDAVVDGKITFTNVGKYSVGGSTAANYLCGIGGVLGYSSTGATLTNCTNDANLMITNTSKTDTGVGMTFGGIVGWIATGDSTISGCKNTGSITNNHNNQATRDASPACLGGIIGSYGYGDTGSTTITVSDCSNEATLSAMSGIAGGIAGYLRKGSVTGCSTAADADVTGTASYIGGIVGIAETESSVSNCTSLSDLMGQGIKPTLDFSAGGIVGYMLAGSTCSDNSYYGIIGSKSYTAESEDRAGGVVGRAEGGAITGNRFGGSIFGTTVNADNLETMDLGDGDAEVSGSTLWNGK